MSGEDSSIARRRNRWLAGAFGLILFAQVGLYFAASLGSQPAIWIFFAMQAAGMLLALWSA